MRVVCVKHGNKYGAEWVVNLQRMVQRHLPIDHEFVCITERPIAGINCIPLLCEHGGWWQKIGLFKPRALPGDNLYLDLDVVLTDSIVPMVALLYQSPGLWARDDFSYSMRNPKQGLSEDFLKLLGGPGCVNSSVMLWKDDVARDVWDQFRPEVMDEMHGDQNHISKVMAGRIKFIPDEMVCSYKYHVLRGERVAPVVVFHGDPKVTQLSRHDPLRKEWER